MQRPRPPSFSALSAHAAAAKDWLFHAALPLWWYAGFDRNARCFFESLGPDGRPLSGLRRVRAQARQTFVYAAAGRLGWPGPWREAASAGAKVLTERCLLKHGGTPHLLGDDGNAHDARPDLYDAAFVIFALAHAGRALERDDLIGASIALADWVHETWAHPLGGLREGDVAPTPPRRQNPHMHLFEAMLALYEITGDARHLERARAIATLVRTRFISPRWNALLEFFNDDWTPRDGDEGRITGPGHQFEWAWLLSCYRGASGEDTSDLIARLHAHGETHGVDAAGFAVDETWADGGVRVSTSRLWPNTERLKANLVLFEESGSEAHAAAALQACEALKAYLTPQGFWRDRRQIDGGFIPEPAPASSFYHIILAYAELLRVTGALAAA